MTVLPPPPLALPQIGPAEEKSHIDADRQKKTATNIIEILASKATHRPYSTPFRP